MQANDIPSSTMQALKNIQSGTPMGSELTQFNRLRASRGLMPVTFEEFTQRSLKIMGLGLQCATV